jgi:parallel beta helix pectate lyase-like protein
MATTVVLLIDKHWVLFHHIGASQQYRVLLFKATLTKICRRSTGWMGCAEEGIMRLKSLTLSLAVLATTLAFFLPAAPAFAQATRTWVSGVGDDANPCSRTAPCKTFAGAISKTAPLGEINVLDPGGFGAVTITKSITIRSDHIEAGVLVSGTNGIVINVAATDKVIIEGLDIDGIGTGLNGINIIGTGHIIIRNCSIRNFTQNGINVAGTLNAQAVVENSLVVSNNGGLNLQGIGGVANSAVIQNSVFHNNTAFATQLVSPSTLLLAGSSLIGSPSSIINTGGTVISYGNNILRNAGAPTQTLPLQ